MGGIEGERFFYILDRKLIFGGNVGGAHLPLLVGDGHALHSESGPLAGRHWDAGRAAPAGNLRELLVVQLLAERAHLFGRWPEAVKYSAIIITRSFQILFDFLATRFCVLSQSCVRVVCAVL